MKTCDEIRELLDAYWDFELTRLERMEVEAHIEQCPDCAKLLKDYEKLFEKTEYIMPQSVAAGVMEQVNNAEAGDLFNEPVDKEADYAMRKRINKREGIKAWGLIAVVLLFAVGYYFLEDYMTSKTGVVKDEAVTEESVQDNAEDVNQNLGAAPGESTLDKNSSVLNVLRESLKTSDSLTVKFGSSKVVLYEQFDLDYVSDYIASNPCEKVEGRVDYKSIGNIKTKPDNKMNIQITDTHSIVFTYNEEIYEIQCEREELLHVFQGVGING